jgi:peroxiredoxin Q/BCP
MTTPLGIGDRVPAFALPDQGGTLVSLDTFLGRGPVVVFFYPKDDSPGCTVEACRFRDLNPEFIAAGATVVGISVDDPASHRAFVEKHQLGYTLLSDVDGKVRGLFGVGKQLLGLVDGRVTFILDKDGVVRHRFDSMLRVKRHVDEALGIVRSLAS